MQLHLLLQVMMKIVQAMGMRNSQAQDELQLIQRQHIHYHLEVTMTQRLQPFQRKCWQ